MFHTYRPALFAMLTLLLGLTGCKKELKAPIPAKLDPGVLTASKDVITIDASAPGSEAVTFSWTAFPNGMIDNSLILTANNKSDTITAPKSAVSRKLTNGELNGIAVDSLGLAIGTEAEIKVQLLAKVQSNGNTASSNTISIKVTPVPTGPPYSQLWIVGDATPNGWDIVNPNEMKKDPGNAFQFTYNEVLKAGEFKIPTSTGDWSTDFFMPPSNHPDLASTAVQLTIGGNPDNKWQIVTAGAYKILLNISSSPFIKITPYTPYPALWMVGDATPAGWDIDAPTLMVQTVGNPYEFTYTGTLTAGEFKIPTSTGNWGTDYFMPVVNDTGAGDSAAPLVPGGQPDNKWKITEAGTYKVTLNQLYETISIVKQ